MESLFDERVFALFSNAGRDCIITLNQSGRAEFVLRLVTEESMLSGLAMGDWLFLAAGVGDAVFLVSNTYHTYVKGEQS
jgi:hypothetical protein